MPEFLLKPEDQWQPISNFLTESPFCFLPLDVVVGSSPESFLLRVRRAGVPQIMQLTGPGAPPEFLLRAMAATMCADIVTVTEDLPQPGGRLPS